jgi:poly(A) polymerase
VSTNAPTPRELEITKTLIDELHTQGCYESKEEGKLR